MLSDWNFFPFSPLAAAAAAAAAVAAEDMTSTRENTDGTT